MFKAPKLVSREAPSPRVGNLDVRALMAEVKFRSCRRKLPPLLGLAPPPEAPDKRNVVLQKLIETGAIPSTSSKPKSGDSPAKEPVLDPTNWDPLYLNRDTALDAMKERHRRESCSSSTGSSSSSAKHHRSSSHSQDEIDPKKGRQMPMEDWNRPAPITMTPTPTLNWGQDILELWEPVWKLASGDALPTPQHNVKSVMKSALAQPLAGRGRGQIL